MTSAYRGSWQASPGGPDYIGLQRRALERIPQNGPPPSLFQTGAYPNMRGRGWWMDTIWTLDEGLNLTTGRVAQGTDHARLVDSTLVSKHYREVTLPPAQVNTAVALGYTASWMQQIHAFDRQIIAIPDTTGAVGSQLYYETSAGAVAVVPTFDLAAGALNTAQITCLGYGFLNGQLDPQLIIGRRDFGGGGVAVGALRFTSFANLQANTSTVMSTFTAQLWGACQTTLPGLPWVFGANPFAVDRGSIVVLRNTDDFGVGIDPAVNGNYSVTLPNMPAGGTFLGLTPFAGAEARVYMLTPQKYAASGIGGTSRCWLESVKQDGYNSNRHDLSQWGLSYAVQGVIWHGGIVLRDERHAAWSNGFETRRIRWNDQPPLYSDRERRLINFYPINDNELVLEVNNIGVGSVTGNIPGDSGVATLVSLANVTGINQGNRGWDDYYVGYLLTIDTGTGAGQSTMVTSYDGVTGIATVSPGLAPRPLGPGDSTFILTPATELQYLVYSWDKGEVTAESERTRLSTTGLQSLPYSANGGAKGVNGYRYGYSFGSFRAGLVPETGRSLFSQAQTLGATGSSGITFAESGFFKRPVLHWPDAIRESNKWLLWAYMGGALYDGQTLTLNLQHTSPIVWQAPVGASINARSRYKPLTKNTSRFRDYDPLFTLTRGTALSRQAHTTGQPLPITLYGEYEEIGAAYR